MPTLTVLFDDPWWVGLIEVEEIGDHAGGRVHRHIFGSEPTGPEVHLFILHELAAILAQPGAAGELAAPTRIGNPKRRARAAARATAHQGVSTQAQEAMRLALEAHKQERKAASRERRDQEAALKRAKAVAKAREKRRGH